MKQSSSKNCLRRELGLFALIAYGVGDILGAGIYALVGEIAGIAGTASWLAFGVALAVAALTALSYAELGAKFPRSGGESYYCQQAFGSNSLALMIGWLVLCSGIVSLATVSRAFAGYLLELFDVAPSLALETISILMFLVVLGGINFWGIRQSSKANIACTVVEASGLVLVIVAGLAFLAGGAQNPPAENAIDAARPPWTAIGQAAAIAFFAFIGFEDMVNVAEEVRSPERNLPIGIIAALVIAGTIYIVVVWIATSVVPAADLASSQAPLLDVIQRAAPVVPIWAFSTIALFAVANTGLLNFIMASRLLYGMGQQGLVPRWISHIHRTTHTPYRSIFLVFIAAFILAVSGSLVHLAGTTSVLLLTVFFFVNLSLILIKFRNPKEETRFRIPMAIPIVALFANMGLISFVPYKSFLAASILFGLGAMFAIGSRFHFFGTAE